MIGCFRAFALSGVLLSLFSTAQGRADTVTIVKPQPSNGAQVNKNFQAIADANCTQQGCHITGWYVYVDELPVYHIDKPVLNTSIDVSKYSDGKHCLIYRAWDNVGAYGSWGDANCTYSIDVQNGAAVTITSPTSNEEVEDPVNVVANSNGINNVAQMDVWDNGQKLGYYENVHKVQNFSINESYPKLPLGSHIMTVYALDGAGKVLGQADVSYSVTSGNGKNSYTHMERIAPNFTCDTKNNCAGGSGHGTYGDSLVKTSKPYPCLDGECRLFWESGTPYYDTLFSYKEHPNNLDSFTNFQADFYSYFMSAQNLQATEFDLFQSVGGTKYMMGGQCDISHQYRGGQGVWDLWNQETGHWIYLDGTGGLPLVPCPRWSSGWHHIQIYTTANHDAKTYTYVSVTIDGKNYSLNLTYPTSSDNWSDVMGVQWQLDLNSNGGSAQELLDEATLTYW